MDWPAAIARHRDALLLVVATMFAMLGKTTAERIPRTLRNSILRILRPAEAAVRRLIFIAAKDIEIKPSLSKPLSKDKKIPKSKDQTKKRRFSFQLSDNRGVIEPQPRRKFAKIGPRVSTFDDWTPRPAPPPRKPPEPTDGTVNAQRLMERLWAIKEALENIPKQAKRLARWKARRRRQSQTRLVHVIPLKAGRPPYLPDPPRQEVEEILLDCHHLAWEVRVPDTS
jgi:hypothetical protein